MCPQTGEYASKNAVCYNLYGEILIRKQNFKEAQKMFQKALEFDKTFALAYANYGFAIFLEQSNVQNTVLESMINVWSSQEGQNFNITLPIQKNLNASQSELSIALYLMEKAIRIDDKNPNFYWIRGDIKFLAGVPDYCLDYHTAKVKGSIQVQAAIDERCR